MKEENLIKKVCEEFSLTQAELSRELDVSPATITEWSKGKIPKMTEKALKLMIENRQLKEHLKNIKKFYETIQKI